MKLLPSAYTLNVETLQMEKKCEWWKMNFFNSTNLATISERKLLRLKYIKYFRGRKENPKSTNKKAKQKVFSEKMRGFSKRNSSFIIKNKYSWPIIFVTWKQVYFNPLSISVTSPSPLTYIKLNNLTWNMGVALP